MIFGKNLRIGMCERMDEWKKWQIPASIPPFSSRSYISMLLLLLLTVVAGVLLLPQPLLAQEDSGGQGTITAQIDMGTADEPLPAGLEAELLFLPNGQGPPVITTQPIDDAGTATFTDLDTAPQHRYLVRVTVEGQEYFSQLLAFDGNETDLSTSITVYAATAERTALSVDRVNLITEARGNQWVIATLYVYNNSSDRLIAPAAGDGVFIPLPASATDLTFQDQTIGEEAERLANGMQLNSRFPPGQQQIVFSYVMPYQPPEQTLELPVAGPVAQMALLVSDLGQGVSVPSFTSTEPLETDSGQTYLSFEGTNVPADFTLEITMRELPAETPAAQQSPSAASPQEAPVGLYEQLPWWTPLLFMVLAAAGVILYLSIRPAPTEAEERASRRHRREALLDRLAELDDRFDAGDIGERTYQIQRDATRRELRQLLQQEGGAPPSHQTL